MMHNLHDWKKRFITIWTGQALSQFSSAIVQFAIIWYLTETIRSSLALAIAIVPKGMIAKCVVYS